MTVPTEPTFIRVGLFTRCVCPLDGTAMHVTKSGFWECAALLHQWNRHSRGVWKLMKTWVK